MNFEGRPLRKDTDKPEVNIVEQTINVQELGGLPEPSQTQKEIYSNLYRLYLSLRGPEQSLDRNYGRPFPPLRPQPGANRAYVKEAGGQ